jgi:hypothetical protein
MIIADLLPHDVAENDVRKIAAYFGLWYVLHTQKRNIAQDKKSCDMKLESKITYSL